MPSVEAKAEADRLSQQYEKMAQDFAETGLDLKFVQDNSTKYKCSTDGCQPLDYTVLPEPLAERGVRLCVLPLEEAPHLVEGAAEVTRSIKDLLPTGTHTYENAAQLLHITVFHFSRPDDPRPVSTSLNDSDAITAMPILQRPGATSKEIARERDLLSDLVTRAQHISGLQVHSVVMATSGTLLLLYTEQAPDIASLRSHLRSRAPGAPRKQAAILHSTLLRILTPRQLEPDVIAAIQEQCQRWTQQLRGTTLSITRAWYIIESFFSTIDGERTVMQFGAEGGKR